VSTPDGNGLNTCAFQLANTGQAGPTQGEHPEDVSKYLNGDVYRLSATVDDPSWSVWLPNRLATASAGRQVQVPVYARQDGALAKLVRVKVTATSESDPTKTATATCYAFGR
jgi:hypothetical protein